MKKNLFKLALLIPALAGGLMAFAPTSVNVNDEPKTGIIIENPEHDFGTIKEDGGPVTATFTILNATSEDIVFTSVRASCGCTTPNWTKEPIAPGKTGKVTATYNPKGHPGSFTKTVTATTNTDERLVMYIKGVVETAPAVQ
jgi:hypothetical protein